MNAMDNKDTSRTKSTETNPTKTVATSDRALPGCARCHNHNLSIALKSHKRYCKYRYCTCEKCLETLARQKKMAKKTRQQRARKQDEDKKIKGKKPEEVDPTPSDVEDVTVGRRRKNNNLEILLQYSMREMYPFCIAWPLMSLVTTIVKYGQEYSSEIDIAEAISRITRASIIRHPKIIRRKIRDIILFLTNLFPP